MIGSAIITKFREMVQDGLDSDYELQLLNDAKDEVEAMIEWEQLVTEQSYSVPEGYTFTTALGVLPTRLALPIRLVEGTSYLEYDKVDFSDRARRANASYAYFIDLANGNIHLSGSNHAAATVFFYFTKYSADIALATEWAFPGRFHAILAYKMAELYYASNAGEQSRSWDRTWSAQYERKLSQMTSWNDNLKLANRRPRSSARGSSPRAIN